MPQFDVSTAMNVMGNPLMGLAGSVAQSAGSALGGAFTGMGIAKAGEAEAKGMTNQAMAGYLGDVAQAQGNAAAAREQALGTALEQNINIPVGAQIDPAQITNLMGGTNPAFVPSPAPNNAPGMPNASPQLPQSQQGGYLQGQVMRNSLIAMGQPVAGQPGQPQTMTDATNATAPPPVAPSAPRQAWGSNGVSDQGFNALNQPEFGAMQSQVENAQAMNTPGLRDAAQETSGVSPYQAVENSANNTAIQRQQNPIRYAAGAIARNILPSALGGRRMSPNIEKQRQSDTMEGLKKVGKLQSEYDKARDFVNGYMKDKEAKGQASRQANFEQAVKKLPTAEMQNKIWASIFTTTSPGTAERADLLRQAAISGMLPLGNDQDQIEQNVARLTNANIVSSTTSAGEIAKINGEIARASMENLRNQYLPKYLADMEKYRQMRDEAMGLVQQVRQLKLDYDRAANPQKLAVLQQTFQRLQFLNQIAMPNFERGMAGTEAYIMGTVDNILYPRDGSRPDPNLTAKAHNLMSYFADIKHGGQTPADGKALSGSTLKDLAGQALQLINGYDYKGKHIPGTAPSVVEKTVNDMLKQDGYHTTTSLRELSGLNEALGKAVKAAEKAGQ